MTLDLKTILFAAGYIATCLSFLFAFLYKVKGIERDNATFKKILFLDNGGLNVVKNDTCRMLRSEINKTIQRESGVTKEALEQIKCLSDNIIIIMTKMELEPRRVRKKKQN